MSLEFWRGLIADCASPDVPKRNLDHRFFLSLSPYVNDFSQIICFSRAKLILIQVLDCYWNFTVLQSSSMFPSLLCVRH